MPPSLRICPIPVRHQRQEELEPGSIGGIGVELDSGGKQCCLIKALKALSLAFSRLNCSVSVLIRSLSLLICSISLFSYFIRNSCCILRCSYCSMRSS